MELSSFDIQAEFCKAMGHPTRLQILHILQAGPLHVNELVHHLGLSQSMVSRQLHVLRSAGVVSCQRHGTEMVYQLTDTKIGEVCNLVRTVLSEQSHRRSQIIRE